MTADPGLDAGWWGHALCSQTDPDLFFPKNGDSGAARAARRICARCPVLEPCRDWALRQPNLAGIWGGMSERERRRERVGLGLEDTRLRKAGLHELAGDNLLVRSSGRRCRACVNKQNQLRRRAQRPAQPPEPPSGLPVPDPAPKAVLVPLRALPEPVCTPPPPAPPASRVPLLLPDPDLAVLRRLYDRHGLRPLLDTLTELIGERTRPR